MFYTGDVSGIVAFSDLFDSLLTDNGWIIHRTGAGGERHYTSPVVGTRPQFYFGRTNSIRATDERYNWSIRAFQYPDPDKPLTGQPGVTPNWGFFQLASPDTNIRYWLSVTSDRVTGWVRIGQQYLFIYQGFYISYQTPNECPFNVATMGSSCEDLSYLSQSGASSQYPNPWTSTTVAENPAKGFSALVFNTKWRVLFSFTDATNPNVESVRPYPCDYSTFASVTNGCQADSGEYALIPSVLYTHGGGMLLGELDGVMRISGFNLTPETELTVDGKRYILFPNHTRADQHNICALEVK